MRIDDSQGYELLDQLADEIAARLRRGERPSLQEYTERHPELADDGRAAPSRFEAINRGWVSITRPWHLVSVNTGLGDPRPATAEKGQRLMEALTLRLGDFLTDLALAEMDERFPY